MTAALSSAFPTPAAFARHGPLARRAVSGLGEREVVVTPGAKPLLAVAMRRLHAAGVKIAPVAGREGRNSP